VNISGSYGSIVFAGNASTVGGAINAYGNLAINATVADTLAFTDNSSLGNGGAVTASDISINGSYGNILFASNTASGGAIGGAIKGSLTTISATVAGTLAFTNNTAGNGGAIGANFDFILNGSYGAMLFASNTTSGQGGAITSNGGRITIGAIVADTLAFTDNYSSGYGGALAASMASPSAAATAAFFLPATRRQTVWVAGFAVGET
jgi:predicted outer membrane repeat protein